MNSCQRDGKGACFDIGKRLCKSLFCGLYRRFFLFDVGEFGLESYYIIGAFKIDYLLY